MLANPRTFRCPNCNEMINDSMTQCRYCSVPVDPGVAQLIADRQEKANHAYSDASFIRTAAIATYVFLAISFIPLLGMVSWAVLITFFVVIVLLVRWQVRYSNLVTNDADFQSARRSWWISLVMILALPIVFTIRVVFVILFPGPQS